MNKNIAIFAVVVLIIVLVISTIGLKKGGVVNSNNGTSIEKAITSLNKAIADDSNKIVTEQSYQNFYSYHYFGSSDWPAFIIAKFDDPNTQKGGRWDLISLEKDGTKNNLYSGLVQDCCGGGMPELKIGRLPFLIEVSAATGDMCSFVSERLYFNVRENPKTYVKVENSNACKSFSNLSIGGNNIETFKFEPIITTTCTAQNVGTKTSFVGLIAKSNAKTYTKYFNNPVEVYCVKGEDFEGYTYSKSVNYTDTEVINNSIFDFNVSVYSPKEEKTTNIPVTFSLVKGF